MGCVGIGRLASDMTTAANEVFPLTVENVGVLAEQLSDVLGEFEAWGLKISPASRLPRILATLRGVVSDGQYAKASDELLRVGAAIQTAQEFIEIANTLPDEPIAAVADDLRIALAGGAEWRPKKKGHLQRQTQLWVGAMMVQAGAPTGVLERPVGKNPDFELENGASRYAVEVKRPESANGVARLVSDAAAQIRSGRYHGGTIVVDLTDCMDESTVLSIHEGTPDLAPVNESLIGYTRTLHEQIFDDAASLIRVRRDHVFSLLAFTRYVYWNSDDLTVPFLGRAVVTIDYQKGGPNTLKALRARWLGRLVHNGIMASGHQNLGEVDVTGLST